jgi:hypothetical protein
MFSDIKHIFPLHFAVFRSVAHCINVEANTERLFSFSGRISDPNMSPSTLSKYAYIAKNADLEPSLSEVKAAYCKKYKSFVLPIEVRFRQKKPPGAPPVTLKFRLTLPSDDVTQVPEFTTDDKK